MPWVVEIKISGKYVPQRTMVFRMRENAEGFVASLNRQWSKITFFSVSQLEKMFDSWSYQD